MNGDVLRTIRLAAALIDDDHGRLLLVRKTGSDWFMQAGGKIEDGESPIDALGRELMEEIGLAVTADEARHLGRYRARAANEIEYTVDADVFHIRRRHDPAPSSEIIEALWVDYPTALTMPLAPLTRDHILPLSRLL